MYSNIIHHQARATILTLTSNTLIKKNKYHYRDLQKLFTTKRKKQTLAVKK